MQSTLEFMAELAEADRERLPVSEWTLTQAMRCCLRECCGDYFRSKAESARMKDNFDFVSVYSFILSGPSEKQARRK